MLRQFHILAVCEQQDNALLIDTDHKVCEILITQPTEQRKGEWPLLTLEIGSALPKVSASQCKF